MNDNGTAQLAGEMAAQLIDVEAVARLLDCSTRHVYRLADRGAMPPPFKIGALVRWPRQSIEKWIAGGCKTIRQGKVS